MRIRDEYLHGSDLTGVVKKIEVTIGTGNNANKSVIKYIKADSEGGIVEVPIGDITGKAATASKLDNTSAIGSKINPVYFTSNGVPSTCTYSLNATVPVGSANKVLYYSALNTLDVQSYATLTSNLDVFTVATASAAGKKGLVPAPAANQLGAGNFFLRADGVWTVIESKSAALNGTATSLVTTGEKYNWNSAYNWYNSMTSGDTDGVINKWKEVEAFLANYGDSSTLAAELAKLVTLSTDQTITGVKTFSLAINADITGNADTVDGRHATYFWNFKVPSKSSGYWDVDEVLGDTIAAWEYGFSDSTSVIHGPIGDNVEDARAYYTLGGVYCPLQLSWYYTNSASLYARTYYNRKWYSWKKIAFMEDITWNNVANKPTSLPANGGNADYATSAGNADTVDGLHASDIYGHVMSDDLNNVFTPNGIAFSNYDYATSVNVINQPKGDNVSDARGVITFGLNYSFQLSWYYYNAGNLYARTKFNDTWTSWVKFATVSDIPTKVSSFTNDAGYLTSHAYSYGSIDIYDVNGAKKTSNNTVSASVNTETLRLQEGANISITATNSGTSGGDSIKIAVTGIESNINQNGYGQLALWYNGAPSVSATLQSSNYNELLTVKAGSGIDFSGVNGIANKDVWTISAIPYNCAITLNNNSTKSLIKDSWSADKDSVYLTSNGTSGGTSLAAGTYALWIEDRSSSSGTPNYYSGTFTCAGSATAGRLDEIALHSSMATSADTNAPTRIFVATLISNSNSNTPGKHVLRFCSLDSKATPHYLTVKVNRLI